MALINSKRLSFFLGCAQLAKSAWETAQASLQATDRHDRTGWAQAAEQAEQALGLYNHKARDVTTVVQLLIAQAERVSPCQSPHVPHEKEGPMSYTHHGSAQVVLSANPFGVLSGDPLSEVPEVLLDHSATPGVACLELKRPVAAPPQVCYVWVLLPSGLAFAGPVMQDERQPDGSGWLTFQINEPTWDCGNEPVLCARCAQP